MGKDLASDTEAQANGLSDGKNMVPSEQETTEVGEILAANERTTLGRITLYLSGFQVESRGIERVPEDERYDTSVTNAATVWLSSNMTVCTFSIGVLATPVFGLGYVESILTILFINMLGVLPVAFYSTFGPRFGLRQMVLGRYWFGFHAVKIFAVLNSIAAICWSAVNSIVGAQLLHAVNSDIPGWAGIIIIAAGCGIITLFGYKFVHLYQKWSWIPCFIIFLIVIGEFAHSGNFENIKMRTGSAAAGSVISFAASVFGNSTGWSTYAADYSVYMPKDTSPKKVFVFTYLGLCFPLVFTQMLGATVATATVSNTQFSTAYDKAGIGGLVGAVLFPRLGKFGHFCMVILALGIIANNCPNQYSISLNLQLLSTKTQRIPRFLWTALSVIAFAALAIGGYEHFESFLENFMLIIAYWTGIYEAISLTEHFVFRRGFAGYNPADWNQPSTFPPGFAALVAFAFGIMGGVLGVAKPWFIGPIGKLIGNPNHGGDVGFELAFAFSGIAYVSSRFLEKRHYGR